MNGKIYEAGAGLAVWKLQRGEVMLRYFMIFLLLLSGCAGHPPSQPEMETGAPVVYIHPLVATAADLSRASVAVLPFIVPNGMEAGQGERVAVLFQDVLLGKQAFQTVKMVNRHYGSLAEATAIAGEAGTDLVLAGRIKYLLSGTSLGGSRVELSVRVIDVGSGDTVWYIEQAMDQKMDHPDVSLAHRLGAVFSNQPVRESAGPPAADNMLVHIAVDMADVMAGARYVAKKK
jgi:TolB-like protein